MKAHVGWFGAEVRSTQPATDDYLPVQRCINLFTNGRDTHPVYGTILTGIVDVGPGFCFSQPLIYGGNVGGGFRLVGSRDLKIHVDAISSKYIRPDEGTYDFALMYLPSEGVYYELVCGKTGALLKYAHEKRVFPVSPTTFTSQLQVIALGLKGMQIEQRAHEVMAYVSQLQNDFGRFRDDFQVVGKHIGNAQSKFAEAEKRLDRFDTKLERAAETEAEMQPAEVAQELPRALDAA